MISELKENEDRIMNSLDRNLIVQHKALIRDVLKEEVMENSSLFREIIVGIVKHEIINNQSVKEK